MLTAITDKRHGAKVHHYRVQRRQDARIDEDEVGGKQGMKKWTAGNDFSHLDDYDPTSLAPLLRWLGGQVGRNWDDVYSAMVRMLRYDTEMIKEAMNKIAMPTVDGAYTVRGQRITHPQPMAYYSRFIPFYVDADTNKLATGQKQARRRAS